MVGCISHIYCIDLYRDMYVYLSPQTTSSSSSSSPSAPPECSPTDVKCRVKDLLQYQGLFTLSPGDIVEVTGVAVQAPAKGKAPQLAATGLSKSTLEELKSRRASPKRTASDKTTGKPAMASTPKVPASAKPASAPARQVIECKSALDSPHDAWPCCKVLLSKTPLRYTLHSVLKDHEEECQRLEWKTGLQGSSDTARATNVLKYLVGFMNARGGVLKIGINDSGVVLGSDTAEDALDQLMTSVNSLLASYHFFHTEAFHRVQVPVYDNQGTFTKRWVLEFHVRAATEREGPVKLWDPLKKDHFTYLKRGNTLGQRMEGKALTEMVDLWWRQRKKQTVRRRSREGRYVRRPSLLQQKLRTQFGAGEALSVVDVCPSLSKLEDSLEALNRPLGSEDRDLCAQICTELEQGLHYLGVASVRVSKMDGVMSRIQLYSGQHVSVRAHLLDYSRQKPTAIIHDQGERFIVCCLQGRYKYQGHQLSKPSQHELDTAAEEDSKAVGSVIMRNGAGAKFHQVYCQQGKQGETLYFQQDGRYRSNFLPQGAPLSESGRQQVVLLVVRSRFTGGDTPGTTTTGASPSGTVRQTESKQNVHAALWRLGRALKRFVLSRNSTKPSLREPELCTRQEVPESLQADSDRLSQEQADMVRVKQQMEAVKQREQEKSEQKSSVSSVVPTETSRAALWKAMTSVADAKDKHEPLTSLRELLRSGRVDLEIYAAGDLEASPMAFACKKGCAPLVRELLLGGARPTEDEIFDLIGFSNRKVRKLLSVYHKIKTIKRKAVEIGEDLGSGNFGSVKKGTYSGATYAIKEPRLKANTMMFMIKEVPEPAIDSSACPGSVLSSSYASTSNSGSFSSSGSLTLSSGSPSPSSSYSSGYSYDGSSIYSSASALTILDPLDDDHIYEDERIYSRPYGGSYDGYVRGMDEEVEEEPSKNDGHPLVGDSSAKNAPPSTVSPSHADDNGADNDSPASAEDSDSEGGSASPASAEISEDESTLEVSKLGYAQQNEKKLEQDELQEQAREIREKYAEFVHEAMISAQIGNPDHVVGFTGADLSPRHPFLVFKFMPGKDLSRYLREQKRRTRTDLGMKVLADMLCQAASGLWTVHRARIVHRDVAARNFLVGKTNNVCIADFGLSKQLLEGESKVVKCGGGPSMWMAPEAISRDEGSFKTDVFMFGIFLYECFRLQPFPYPELLKEMGSRAHQHVATQVVKHDLRPDLAKLNHKIHAGLSERLLARYKQLMVSCWSKEPEKRPSMEKVYLELESIKREATGEQ